MADDIISEFMRRLLSDVPMVTHDEARRMEDGLRRDFGGAKHYAKKAPAEGKALRLGSALAAGVSLDQAFADAGVHRSWGFRLLKRRYK